MRVTASGVGKTLEEAMVRVREQLASGSLHVHEVDPKKAVKLVEGKALPDAEQYRKSFAEAKLVEDAVRSLGACVKPVPGHNVRVLVLWNDDPIEQGKHNAARIEVDLVPA